MRYTVKVTCTYPVDAVSAENALNTVPMLIKINHLGIFSEAITEIQNAEGQVVLRAKLGERQQEASRR